MVGKTAAFVAVAVLGSTAEASPFFKWSPWNGFTLPHGWGVPTAYAPPVPHYTVPAWPWWPGLPGAPGYGPATTTTTKRPTSTTTTVASKTSVAIKTTSTATTASKPVSITASTRSAPSTGLASSSTPSNSWTVSASSGASTGISISLKTSSQGHASIISSVPSATASASKSKVSACSKKSRTWKSASASVSTVTRSLSASSTGTAIIPRSTGASASSNAITLSPSVSSGSQASASATVSSGNKSRSACSAKSKKSTISGSASRSTPIGSVTASIGISSGPATAPSASNGLPSASLTISRTRGSGSAVSTGRLPIGTGLSPCASVSQLAASQSGKAVPTVPAKLGYDCLNSIPFHQDAAVSYLDSIRPFLNWQSTTEYLKNPPAEYAAKVQPPYDFRANFERIYSQAKAGDYANEYQFGFDVYRAFQRSHDGHFVIYPASVTTLITFGRLTPLVSVSLDGISVPEVFVYSDILAASFQNSTYTPSPLAQINGRNSTEYLLDFAQNGSLQDRDALWNNVFYELAQIALGASGTGTGTFSGSGRGRLIYPGPITTLTFANGTSQSYDNFARVLKPFTGISSGADLYQRYLTLPSGEPQGAFQAATASTSSAQKASTAAPISSRATNSARTSSTVAATVATTPAPPASVPAPGYPTNPVVRERVNLNAGYFLEGAGYDDVAVLAVNSFVSSDADELPFQSVNTYLIDQAVKYNKTKLIVDVSANGGGTILQGYDLFKQLFPQVEPYEGQRARAHEAINLIGREYSAYSERVPRSIAGNNDTTLNIISSFFNYQTDVDVNEKPFTSWAEKYGPYTSGPQPDNYTTTFRWNLTDVLTPINSGGIYVSGYLERKNITAQPFKPENIVVVTDGYCASTCTIFSELMRQQGGVKFVALGGRPNKDIIQAVGGVKGTNSLTYSSIFSTVGEVFDISLLDTPENYNKTVLNQYNDRVLLQSSASVVNFRDGIRAGETTPLQFVYEAADCRIYYTPEMTVDITASWKAVVDSAFNGKNRCIAGSLGSTSAPQKRSIEVSTSQSSHEKGMLYDSIASLNMGQGNAVNADSVMII